MSGRDLIIYILQNDLEDEPVFKDGKLLGFMTASEAAVKFEVGMATIQTWYTDGYLEGFMIRNQLYIPANTENPKHKIRIERRTNTHER